MLSQPRYDSPQEFLETLDSGTIDRNLEVELKRLTHEQREMVARLLVEREAARIARTMPSHYLQRSAY